MEGDTEPGSVKIKHKVPRHVLDSFEKLVHEDALKQSKASIIILKHADGSLQNYSATELPKDVIYIVRRLVNGLMSSRLRAREGYYTALQALLQLHPSTVHFAFQTVKEKCCDNKAANKLEAREQIIAELLSYGALIRSGQAHGNPEIRSKIITRLFQMRQMKTYLDTMATQFLVNLMEKCEGADMYKDVLNHLENKVFKPLEELSPCLLWLRLIMLKKQKQKAPAGLTSTLAPKNYPVIGRIVMQTGADLPKVHPLLEEVVSSLASCDDREGSPLVKFWVSGLAPYLENPSPSRLQLLFNVLQLILPKLKMGSEVTAVVSDSLIALLLTTVSRHDKDISYAARGLASALLQLVTANQDETSDVQLAVIRALIVPPGSVRFDQLTGTKLLAQMKTHFTFTTIKGIAKTLIMIMKKQILNVKPLDQSCAAHTLKNLVMHPKVMCEDHLNWRTKQLIVLMKVAFFTPGEAVHLLGFRDAFLKALCHHAGHIKEYRAMLLSIVSVAHQELQSCETTGTSPLSVEVKELWSEVYDKLCSLQKKEVMTIANEVFQVLYCQMALHLFIDSIGAKDIIDELSLCHKEVMKMEKKKKKSKGEKVEESPQWVEVVTELLLSLLTHEKSLFRTVTQGVFWLMSPLVTHTALTLVVDVLDPAKSSELISKEENERETEDEDEEGMEAQEEEGDEERMDTDEENDVPSEDDADDDSEEDDDDDDDDDKEDEPGDENMNLFDMKKKMLAVIGDIDRDVDMDSVPGEELNNMNNQLGALMAEFLNRQKRKKKGAIENLPKDEKSLMHFRTRVCDLLDVYIKKASNMDIIVALVNPLLKALHTADQDKRQQALQCRLRLIIHMLAKVRKFGSTGDATIDGLINTLDDFFAIASEMPESYTAVVQECYSFLFHCGCQLLGEDSHKPDNPLIKAFANHMEKLFTQNTMTVKVYAFAEPCSFDCGGLWNIVKLMVKYAFDPEIKVYRRSQALHVLQKCYQNKALMSQISDDATRTEEELAKKTVNTLNSFQTPESMHAQYVSNLFSLVRVIHKSHTLNGTHKSFNWEKISTAILGIRQRISRKTLNSFRGQYNSLQQALKLPKMVCNIKTNEKVPKINTTALLDENSTDCTLGEGSKEQQKEGKILNLGNEKEDTVMKGKTDKKTKKSKKSEQSKILSIENNEDDAIQKIEKGTTEKQKKKKRKHESILEAEMKEPVNESPVDSHNRIKKKKKLLKTK